MSLAMAARCSFLEIRLASPRLCGARLSNFQILILVLFRGHGLAYAALATERERQASSWHIEPF